MLNLAFSDDYFSDSRKKLLTKFGTVVIKVKGTVSSLQKVGVPLIPLQMTSVQFAMAWSAPTQAPRHHSHTGCHDTDF